MTCTLEVIDPSGHLTLGWDPTNAASVEHARAEFDRLKAAGYAFFADSRPDAPKVTRLGKKAFDQPGALDVRPEKIREFSPTRRRTTAVGPMVGG